MIVFGRNLSKLLRILKAVSVVVADPKVTPS
jgi:alkyl hydroperoxide reductase subunit AhpC